MISAIARREIRSMFRTPFAWVLLCVSTVVIAYQFLAQLELFIEFGEKLRALEDPPGVTEVVVVPTIGLCAFLCLFLTPLVTMQSISAERRLGTIALLYSSPVTTRAIVIGKFIGALGLFFALWLIVAVMMFSIMWGAPIDLGVYAANLLALLLLMSACVSVGLLASSCFQQASAAGAACFGVLMCSWFADWASRLGNEISWLGYISAMSHFQRIASGLFDSADVLFFLLVTVASLVIAGWRLQGDRLAL